MSRYLNDLPLQSLYKQAQNKQKQPLSYRKFKRQFQENALWKESGILKNPNSQQALAAYKEELLEEKKKAAELKSLGKVNVVIHRDKAEVLLDTSYNSLYKHGYRAKNTWGIMRETLAASCLVHSGVLDSVRASQEAAGKAAVAGKKRRPLLVWDPFCGSGTFLIELLQMAAQAPLGRGKMRFPF